MIPEQMAPPRRKGPQCKGPENPGLHPGGPHAEPLAATDATRSRWRKYRLPRHERFAAHEQRTLPEGFAIHILVCMIDQNPDTDVAAAGLGEAQQNRVAHLHLP